jgi:hypothetical protein
MEKPMTLSDTHLIILSAAQQRDGLVLPIPDTVRASPEKVHNILRQLLKSELVCEQPAEPGQEFWRESEEGGRLALLLTEAGKARLGAEGDADESDTKEQSDSSPPSPEAPVRRSGTQRAAKAAKTSSKQKIREDRPAKPSAEPAAGGKIGVLVKLFSRKSGASIEEAIKATGWQAHSVRGAISGALKKKHGFTVASEANANRGRVYRIVR